jgi:phage-related protein
MSTVGAGVREIGYRDQTGAHRTICLATLPDAVHVYHVLARATGWRAIDLIRERKNLTVGEVC